MALALEEEDPRTAQFGAPGDVAHGAPTGTNVCPDCSALVQEGKEEAHQKWHVQFEVLRGILDGQRAASGGHVALACRECGGTLLTAHANYFGNGTPKRIPIGYWCPKCGRLIAKKEALKA